MSNERPRIDGDSEALLQQLASTPVGRRWLIKVGLGAAAAAAASRLPSLSRSDTTTAWAEGINGASGLTAAAAQPSAAPAARQPSPTKMRTLQLVDAGSGLSNLELVAVGVPTLPLITHTNESRAALKAQGGVWAKATLSALSHYVQDVPLPTDRTVLMSVYGTRGSVREVVGMLWHIPEDTTLGVARLAAAGGKGLHSLFGPAQRLQTLGLSAADVSAPEHVAQLSGTLDGHATAVTLTTLHPQVATKDSTLLTITQHTVGATDGVGALGSQITTLHSQAKPWSTAPTITDPDGTKTQFQFATMGLDGKPVPGAPTELTLTKPVDDIKTNLTAAVAASIKSVRATPGLGQVTDKPITEYPQGTAFKTWIQHEGVTPQAQRTPSPTALGSEPVEVHFDNPGWNYGTKTEANGTLDANRNVQISIYNDYLRWIWAYVQYLGSDKDGNTVNLSIDQSGSRKWPDSDYSQSLGLVPQVPTILAIPLFGQNKIDVTLSFPKEAHSARLLYCGLGNTAIDGGWRQYFPADAYPNRISPQTEVLFPALMTGIFTIGLNLFALVTDIQVGLAWNAARKTINKIAADTSTRILTTFGVAGNFPAISTLTIAETAAFALATGGATAGDAVEGDKSNVWAVLLGLGSLIPKLLFSKATLRAILPALGDDLLEFGAAIAAEEVTAELTKAIPVLGMVLSAIAVVADVASLAEVAVETGISPWVIANKANLTYQVDITVHQDTCAATFPEAATKCTLQAKLDGAVVGNPTDITVNAGGRTQSGSLTQSVTAPFGGDTIQWTAVFTDADGVQVATGVSPAYTNNDPTNPPGKVDITIKDLEFPLTSTTVFRRADTTTYSETAGGYTWSNQVTDNGVVGTVGIDEVTGATVATTLGVVGMVWKQNGKYYVRGVPMAENSSTIPQLPATQEGYLNPPFLLFDSYVDRQQDGTCSSQVGVGGNHVLLEPDPAGGDGYVVRWVGLNSETGELTWDKNKAHGAFTLPVSAAALGSSGHIVTVDTNSGRVGVLHPQEAVDPRFPALAFYKGGSPDRSQQDTEIAVGVLQSPIAVAVTHPGVIIVLEAGAQQLAAFDLNGDVIKYFGTDANNLQPTVPLRTRGWTSQPTYLDMAVDGASHIYLLYYTGDGSRTDDYYIDVYDADGVPLVTNSPGVNIAKLSVDFWRTIYGVNYTAINHPNQDLGGVKEPSISRLDPHNFGSAA